LLDPWFDTVRDIGEVPGYDTVGEIGDGQQQKQTKLSSIKGEDTIFDMPMIQL